MLRDIRMAFRLFAGAPWFTAAALISIALSVGATAVVFTAVKAVLLDPLPYSHPQTLVQLRSETRGFAPSHADWVFWNDAEQIRRRNRTLESVGVYGNAVFDLGGGDTAAPEALYGLRISAGLFPTLGVSPMLGRNILPGEDRLGHSNEIILSYGLWMRRFNRDPGVVGRKIRVNGRACVVLGVMPPGFNFPLRRAAAHTPFPYVEFWAPLGIEPEATRGGLGAVARLRPGVSVAEAEQDIAAIGEDLEREFPASNRERALRVSGLWDRTVASARKPLLFLMAGALLFLLIGCINVANLLLARGFFRQREFAVRMALGAGRGRVIRQLLTESCVLALAGGVAGYVIALAAWKALPAIAPTGVPRLATAHVDSAILAFTILIALANGIAFGIAPAFRSAGGELSLRSAVAAKSGRMGPALVMAEVALTVVLVLIGGEVLDGFSRLLRVDPGFDAKHVLASVILPARERYPTPEKRGAVYRRFLDAVRAVPGVEVAGTVDALPFSGENHGGYVSAGGADSRVIAEIDVVGGEYLQAMGTRLIAGRWFREDDMREANDSAIVSQLTASRLWPGQSAVGKGVCVDCTPEAPNNWKRVLGVVSGIRHADLDAAEPNNAYLPAAALERAAFLVVRTDRPTGAVGQAIRWAIAAVDPDQPVLLSASLESLVADSIADRRFLTLLLPITACAALAMALVGVYGITFYTVSRRTQEVGVRMALGATPGDVCGLVFRNSFSLVVAGLGLGVALGLAVARAVHSLIVGFGGITGWDTAFAVGLVAATAAMACLAPARRATRIQPVDALREE
jgi:putative ABC transport system permease protein